MVAAGTVPLIAGVLGHERSQGAGQMKEDDEGIPFHTLLTAGMHRGDRISWRKSRRRVCSVPALVPVLVAVYCAPGDVQRPAAAGGRRPAAGEGRSRGSAGGEEEQGRRCFCFLVVACRR
jgi:hypothetical protein